VALKTTLATRFWLKTIIMAIVCIVLGLWGIWDYVVAIPQAQIGAARATLLRDVIPAALETPVGSDGRAEAIVLLKMSADTTYVSNEKDTGWIVSTQLFEHTMLGSGVPNSEFDQEYQRLLNMYGDITPPSKFDRPMQWLFIVCLPFGFYYLYTYSKMKKRAGIYCLDDGGTLTTPEGTWGSDDIGGMDMSRWIAKTGNARSTWTAKVLVTGRSPILLDDYIYTDMHLIIGALAHTFYPEDWTPLAKRIPSKSANNENLCASDSEEE